MLAVGVIGAGSMGARHLLNLERLPGTEVVAIAEPDAERAESFVVKRVYGDPDDLIADPHVQAVVIASPDHTHARLTLRCLEAGKPVLCEKPLGVSAREAHAVVMAEQRQGRRLVQVGFMREYDQAHIELKRMVEGGELGRVLRIGAVHLNPGTERSRPLAEVMFQSAIHDFHTLRFLGGAPVGQIYARNVEKAGAAGSSALLEVVAELTNGVLGTILMHTEAPAYDVGVEVIGTDGTGRTLSDSGTVLRRSGEERRQLPTDWLGRFAEAYRRETAAWAAASQGSGPFGPSSEDGYRANVAAEACLESVLSGSPVTVDHGR